MDIILGCPSPWSVISSCESPRVVRSAFCDPRCVFSVDYCVTRRRNYTCYFLWIKRVLKQIVEHFSAEFNPRGKYEICGSCASDDGRCLLFGPVPQRACPGTPKSSVVCQACHSRESSWWQRVFNDLIACESGGEFNVSLRSADTSSRGETRTYRVSRRTGWECATTAANGAWTPCPWRRVLRTSGWSRSWSMER